MISKSKLDESYLLFKQWWESIELNNYEKGIYIVHINSDENPLKERIIIH